MTLFSRFFFSSLVLIFCSFTYVPTDPFIIEEAKSQDNLIMVSGKIVDANGHPLEGIEVYLNSYQIEYPRKSLTDGNGYYSFGFVETGFTYELSAATKEKHAKNVSTLDYAFIIRHMLGLQEHLDHPYKIIAADTNADNKLTMLDLKNFRKVILGVFPKFPEIETMRFLNADYDFPDPKNPWPDENGSLYIIQFKPTQDVSFSFVGITIGDVN